MKLMYCDYCTNKKYTNDNVVCAICKYCLNEMKEIDERILTKNLSKEEKKVWRYYAKKKYPK